MYSQTVMDHFKNPRNVGDLKDADGVGEVGNPLCGDMMSLYIKVKDDRIDDIKFLTFGCGAAIAVSSMITEMAKGKTLDEAKKITNKSVADALQGLPKNKLHCSNLGADALHLAIGDYERKRDGKPPLKTERVEPLKHDHDENCYCPYCDADVTEDMEYCSACGKKVKGGGDFPVI